MTKRLRELIDLWLRWARDEPDIGVAYAYAQSAGMLSDAINVKEPD